MTNFWQITEDPVPGFNLVSQCLTTFQYMRISYPANLPTGNTAFLFLNKCSCSHTFLATGTLQCQRKCIPARNLLELVRPLGPRRACERFGLMLISQGCGTSGLAAAECCGGMSFCKVMGKEVTRSDHSSNLAIS